MIGGGLHPTAAACFNIVKGSRYSSSNEASCHPECTNPFAIAKRHMVVLTVPLDWSWRVFAWWQLITCGAIRAPFLGLAALLVIVAHFAPGFLRLANHVWMRFSHLVSCVMNPVVMAVIFFGVVTPIALLMRLGGKRSLRLAPEPRATSYWTARDPADSVPDGRIF